MKIVTEWQTGVADQSKWPLVRGTYRGRESEYRYDGFDVMRRLHRFVTDGGHKEFYVYRKEGCAGWHLRVNDACYEFVSSVQGTI